MSAKPRLPSSSGPKKHVPLAQDEEEEAPVVGISIDDNFKWATYILFAWQLLMIILLGSVGRDNFIGNNNFGDVYNMFSGVEIMMFFGFGYLMTFLKRYGMGAVGLTMLITVVATQWGMFTEVRGGNSLLAIYLQNLTVKYMFLFLNSGFSLCGMRVPGHSSP